MSLIVYSKPSCVQCTATYRALDAKGIEYTVVDLTTNPAALEYAWTSWATPPLPSSWQAIKTTGRVSPRPHRQARRMSEHDTTSDDYRAGYLAGSTDRQGEVDRLENDADRFYRAAYGEERRIPGH